MGWVMPRELLQGIGKDLHRVAPEREGERIATIMRITANGARNDASVATASLRRRLASEEGPR